jgi:NAD(P)-dependent dehydrogenase (short-subunit alcohol dehydrogenase family)
MIRQQKPIGSGFGHGSTASEVLAGIDLSGKNFIVTGGYSGIGVESVRALVGAGANIVVPVRNREKAEKTLAGMPDTVAIADMDLADLESVEKFAREYADTHDELHGLINNAGKMASPLSRVGRDWESQFAVCHMGHFVLTKGVEKLLKNTEGARVVALSSTAHIICDVHWDDPHFHTHDYDKWQAYGSAKSANALFALGVDQKWQNDGVRAFSVNPGGIFTPLQRHLTDEEMVVMGWKNADGTQSPEVKAMFKNTEQGGATAVWCATNPMLDDMGGLYCEDCDIAPLADENSQRYHHAREWIGNEERADRLWSMTEEMIGM